MTSSRHEIQGKSKGMFIPAAITTRKKGGKDHPRRRFLSADGDPGVDGIPRSADGMGFRCRCQVGVSVSGSGDDSGGARPLLSGAYVECYRSFSHIREMRGNGGAQDDEICSSSISRPIANEQTAHSRHPSNSAAERSCCTVNFFGSLIAEKGPRTKSPLLECGVRLVGIICFRTLGHSNPSSELAQSRTTNTITFSSHSPLTKAHNNKITLNLIKSFSSNHTVSSSFADKFLTRHVTLALNSSNHHQRNRNHKPSFTRATPEEVYLTSLFIPLYKRPTQIQALTSFPDRLDAQRIEHRRIRRVQRICVLGLSPTTFRSVFRGGNHD